MERSRLSLKWLEAFQAVAREGSLQRTADALGLSVSTVSHHLSSLETAVGVALVDHQKRPLRPTIEGEILLSRIDEALGTLRKGLSEVRALDVSALLRVLKISLIEDFDRLVTPGLANRLLKTLPLCDLSLQSGPSHEILIQLQSEDIDIGVATTTESPAAHLIETPLLRDPFVIVAPKVCKATAQTLLSGASPLTFLRYSRKQIIGRRIEAQLRRLRLNVPSRIEFESTTAAFAMVAEGSAWSITTALNWASAAPYHRDLKIMPITEGAFVRQVTITRSETLPESLFELVEASLRALISDKILSPTLEQFPWLSVEFRLLDQSA